MKESFLCPSDLLLGLAAPNQLPPAVMHPGMLFVLRKSFLEIFESSKKITGKDI